MPVEEHRFKLRVADTPSDTSLNPKDGWHNMDVKWLITRETVGAHAQLLGAVCSLPAQGMLSIGIPTPRSGSTSCKGPGSSVSARMKSPSRQVIWYSSPEMSSIRS